MEIYFASESIQNTTIEERVALLEIQVAVVEQDVADLDQDVNFLFDGQVIQDEKLLNLEQETDAIDAELDVIDDDILGKFFMWRGPAYKIQN